MKRPSDAQFDETERAWAHGRVDRSGRRDGVWRFWHSSGSVYGEKQYAKGALDGPSVTQRSTSPTDPSPFDATFGLAVFRVEATYRRGVLVRQRAFAHDGTEVAPDGSPMPERPSTVPADASYIAAAECWSHGPLIGGAPQHGRARLWYQTGELLTDLQYRDGQLHGVGRFFRHGNVSSDIGQPSTGSLSNQLVAQYERGALISTRFTYLESLPTAMIAARARARHRRPDITKKIGVPVLSAGWLGGRLHGPLEWHVAMHHNFTAPVLSCGDWALTHHEFVETLRGVKLVKAEFAEGRLVFSRAYDEDNQQVGPTRTRLRKPRS